ncbi:MAG: Hsp20/alpha crystallin family protein [Phycisphaerae bacterium]
MSKIPFSDIPFSVQEVRDEFDRLLDRVWHGGLSTAPLDGQDWAPRLNVYDHQGEYLVRVEIPGMKADDVEVSILDNVLTIKGTKVMPEKPPEGIRRIRSECRFGSFCRNYEFPTAVLDEGVSASCKEGVLRIRVPKSPETQGRAVEIKSED